MICWTCALVRNCYEFCSFGQSLYLFAMENHRKGLFFCMKVQSYEIRKVMESNISKNVVTGYEDPKDANKCTFMCTF